jgi:hypothetical protein
MWLAPPIATVSLLGAVAPLACNEVLGLDDLNDRIDAASPFHGASVDVTAEPSEAEELTDAGGGPDVSVLPDPESGSRTGGGRGFARGRT